MYAADPWNHFRRQMPVVRDWAFYDHAAVAPLTAPAASAIETWLKSALEQGNHDWPAWATGVEKCRELGARLIAADPAEIALVPNTSAGISIVAEGFPWQPGDNVVVPADEFPSNQYPWMNLASRGVECRRVEMPADRLDLDKLDAACDSRTRIVAASWVGYASGWRSDPKALAELAHRHGALLFLDAIQGLGVFPLDVAETGVDFLAADGHKWLLGPEGAGLFFTRREHLERLRPLTVGWHSVQQSDFSRIELRWRDSAARFEGGSQNMVGFLGLAASIELLLGFGVHNLARRILETTDEVCQQLTQLGAAVLSRREPEHASGIVSFELPGRDPQQVRAKCRQQHVALSCRGGRLRISAHAYNDERDLEKLLAVLGEV
jgi:selenocysteine lyase/cysteine desulfurase